MGKMIPLRWIEQAEARKMRVIALSEASPVRAPGSANSLAVPLGWLRAWFATLEMHCGNRREPPAVVQLRRARHRAD